jgi:hypothetical protein
LSACLFLLLLLWLDIYTHTPTLSPMVASGVYKPGMVREEMKLGQASPGEPRVMETWSARETVRFHHLRDWSDDCLFRRAALFENLNLLDDIPKVDGLYSLYLRDTDPVLTALYDMDDRKYEGKGLKDFLGIAQISVPITATNSALNLEARPAFMPLATIGQMPIFAEGSNALRNLFATDFDPRQVVFLPLEAKSRITATNRSEAKIVASQLATHRFDFQVEAGAPALLVVAQGFYHPWHAYIDGQATPIWRANYGFQAVEVPGGRHEIKLVYEDRSFYCGLGISAVTLLMCGLVWFGRRKLPGVAVD